MLTSENSTATRRCRRMASTPITAQHDQQQQPQRVLEAEAHAATSSRSGAAHERIGAAEALFDVFRARLMGGELHQVGRLQETLQPPRLLGGEILAAADLEQELLRRLLRGANARGPLDVAADDGRQLDVEQFYVARRPALPRAAGPAPGRPARAARAASSPRLWPPPAAASSADPRRRPGRRQRGQPTRAPPRATRAAGRAPPRTAAKRATGPRCRPPRPLPPSALPFPERAPCRRRWAGRR